MDLLAVLCIIIGIPLVIVIGPILGIVSIPYLRALTVLKYWELHFVDSKCYILQRKKNIVIQVKQSSNSDYFYKDTQWRSGTSNYYDTYCYNVNEEKIASNFHKWIAYLLVTRYQEKEKEIKKTEKISNLVATLPKEAIKEKGMLSIAKE